MSNKGVWQVEILIWCIGEVWTLCYSPDACVKTNGTQLSPFPLHWGTRQGGPLSPLVSGYRISFGRPEAMPWGSLPGMTPATSCTFKWSPTGYTYPGVKLSPDLTEPFFFFSFLQIATKIKKDLNRWRDRSCLPLGSYILYKCYLHGSPGRKGIL